MTLVQFDSQYQGNTCHKLNLDQYYTPYDLAVKCVMQTKRILGNSITEYFETSAGKGAFVKAVQIADKNTPIVAVDIQPKAEGIIKTDFLTMEFAYKKGRCFIGNPPFGAKLSLARSFWKKSIKKGDYVAWILPISQYRNSPTLYEFDLIYSEDLGNVMFSGCKPVRCCFNIYRRPSGPINKARKNGLKTVRIIRSDSKRYASSDYDFRMMYWGGRAGSLIKDGEPLYSGEYKIKVLNPSEKERVRKILATTDWTKERQSVSMKKVPIEVIIRVLRRAGIE